VQQLLDLVAERLVEPPPRPPPGQPPTDGVSQSIGAFLNMITPCGVTDLFFPLRFLENQLSEWEGGNQRRPPPEACASAFHGIPPPKPQLQPPTLWDAAPVSIPSAGCGSIPPDCAQRGACVGRGQVHRRNRRTNPPGGAKRAEQPPEPNPLLPPLPPPVYRRATPFPTTLVPRPAPAHRTQSSTVAGRSRRMEACSDRTACGWGGGGGRHSTGEGSPLDRRPRGSVGKKY